MATVTFDRATRYYPGASRAAVDSVDLHVADGELLVVLGPPGCGKSTLLRMLAGLEEVDAGRILVGDQDVTELPQKDRDVAIAFQNYALYPHMTVAENMAFALKVAGVPKDERIERVEVAAHLLGLEEYLDRKPQNLSGSQRQRVAMARAIVRQPKVFLMDEPLANLDPGTRALTRDQIVELQEQLRLTTIYATQDRDEALSMGDRIALLDHGVVQQVGTATELRARPATPFVAGYLEGAG